MSIKRKEFEVLGRALILFLGAGAGMLSAQVPCSPKIINESGQNNCDFWAEMEDTARLIFEVDLARPPRDEEDSPENKEKLRRWTDSLFLKYEFGHFGPRDWRNERSLPPPDSLLGWGYMIYVRKAYVLPIAEEDFVKRLAYRSSPPMVVTTRPIRPSSKAHRSSPQYEVNGRQAVPMRAKPVTRPRFTRTR